MNSTTAAYETTSIPHNHTKTSTAASSSNDCKANSADPTCNLFGFLVAVVFFVLILYIILALTRILLCFVYRRRVRRESEQNERTNREIEEIGHPFSYLADGGFDNCGFVEPPPTYDQLFKRDEPPPLYEQTANRASTDAEVATVEAGLIRQPSTSSVTSAPATYVRSSVIYPRASGRNSLPTGAFGTSIPPIPAVILDESNYRSRTSTTAGSPPAPSTIAEETTVATSSSQDPPEARSPTREHLI